MLYLLKSAGTKEYLQENLRILAAPTGEEITLNYYSRWVHYELWAADPDVDVDTTTTCGGLVRQSDGKYLVSGHINFDPVEKSGPILAHVTRWNADGSVDDGFGNDSGKFFYDFGSNIGVDMAFDVKVQVDGKIVMVGQCDD